MKSAEAFCQARGLKPAPRDTMVRRLAKSLRATYNIPHGDELVLILGTGQETSNLKAIETWVRNTLLNLDEAAARDVLTHLVLRFGETLEQWEAQRWL